MLDSKKRKLFGVLIIAADLLAVPMMFFCAKLSDWMLSIYTVCAWTKFGGKCVTCGGTHFVNSLLDGKIAEAFNHNQFLFVVGIILVISYIALHCYVLFNSKIAKRVLLIIYSIPSLVIFLSSMLIFLLWRNVPVFMLIADMIF